MFISFCRKTAWHSEIISETAAFSSISISKIRLEDFFMKTVSTFFSAIMMMSIKIMAMSAML